MKIKRFTLLALSVSVLSVGAFVGFKKDKVAKYSPREVSLAENTARSHKGAFEYLRSIRANVKTGRVEYEDVALAKKQVGKNQLSSNKALSINWEFKGPDNIGGRTRGFIIDKDDPNTLYAGSTSGGLFVSHNRGNTWESYSNNLENYAIACIAQAVDGEIYYGTGPIFDAGVRDPDADITRKHISSVFLGGGVFKLLGNGQVEKIVGPSTAHVPGVEWNMINKIAVHPTEADILYVAMDEGVRMTKDGGVTWTIPNGLPTTRYADDVEIGSDGTVMVTYSNSGRLYRSINDSTFQQLTNIPFNGSNISRIEYAIAPTNPMVQYASVAYSTGQGNCLYGVFQTLNKGDTWTRIIDPAEDVYDFFNNGQQCQGRYDNALTVFPNNPYKILIGGITLFRWEQTSFPPQEPNGALNELGSILDFPGNQFYLHADKHDFTFLNDSVLYVATDGGIARCENINEPDPMNITFDAINFGYNVTQYYAMGFGPTGLLIGGAQDNGTSIIGFNFNQGKSGFEVIGGDGFDSDLSNLNPTIGFGASQYGQIRKVTGIGPTLGTSNIGPPTTLFNGDPDLAGACDSRCGPFYSNLRLWESFYDVTSKDSVTFDLIVEKGEVIPAGTKVPYASFTNNIPLTYVTTQDYEGPKRASVLDTLYHIKAVDYVQAVLAAGNLRGPENPINGQNTTLHITRDAVNGDLPVDWIQVAGPPSPNNSSVGLASGVILATEFSKDGNHIFLGTRDIGGGGSLYRVSGINNVYTDADGTIAGDARKAVTRKIFSNFSGSVTGIAVDPNNANNVIISVGNYGHSSHVFRTTQGTTATSSIGTFQSINGTGNTALPLAPAYDVLIEMHDSNLVLIGTDFGVFVTENAFDPDPNAVQWSQENTGIPEVPIYQIRQQTFGIDDSSRGIANTGEIYLVSHARGFYRTTDLVGINDRKSNNDAVENILSSSLKIYPNPAVYNTAVSFVLPNAKNVSAKVYNIAGKLVKEANYGSLVAGPHSISLDAQKLPAGTYILQLTAGNTSATDKFIIQK